MDESNPPHNNQEPGFFGRLGEFLLDNGRLLLTALIIILLIGAGIYAYTQDTERDASNTSVAEDGSNSEGTTIYEGEAQTSNSEQDTESQEENAEGQDAEGEESSSDESAESETESTESSEEESSEEDSEAPGETIYTGTGETSEEESEEKDEEETSGDYTFRAEPGDGVTHLARRAVANYLENNPDQAEKVTPAHKIYMETVLTRNNYQGSLDLEETVNFSESEVEQVVQDAIELPEDEVEDWQPYVSTVSSIDS